MPKRFRCTNRRSALVIAATCAAIFVAGALASLALMNGEWLRAKLEKKLASSLQAEARIASAEFSPWRGKAALSGISIHRKDEDSKLDIEIEAARASVRLLPLLLRQVEIGSLEIDRPRIEYERARPPDPETKPTMERIKTAAKEAIDGAVAQAKGGEPKRAPKPKRAKRPDFHVARLIIRDGAAEYHSRREGAPPFDASLRKLNYSARGVRLNSFGSLTDDATLGADLEMGGTGKLAMQSMEDGGVFQLEGVDLGYADRYFNQRDALIIGGGKMDILGSNSRRDDGAQVKVTGMRVARNADCPVDEFYFLPVDKIVERVEKQGGDIELSFNLGERGAETSDELDALLGAFVQGFFQALANELKPDAIDAAADRAKSAIEAGKASLKRLREKDAAPSPSPSPERPSE